MSGSKTTQTTNALQPYLGAYSNLLSQAQGVAGTPYAPYPGPYVAPFSSMQNKGFGIVGNTAGATGYAAAAPGLATAQKDFNAATTPLWPNVMQYSPSAIDSFYSPFNADVVNTTQQQFDLMNAEQQSNVEGNAAAAGAFGGDRQAVAQSELAKQQMSSEAPVIAGLENTGFQTAQQEFNNQQQAQLGANEANAWLNSQAAFGEANLGQETQNLALQGAGALGQAGSEQQALAQENLNVPLENYYAAQAYPFETTGWLAQLETGLGGAAGSTSTEKSSQSTASSILGGLESAVGLAGMSGGFGSNGWLSNWGAQPYTGGYANVTPNIFGNFSGGYGGPLSQLYRRGGPIRGHGRGIVIPFPMHRVRRGIGGAMGLPPGVMPLNDNPDSRGLRRPADTDNDPTKQQRPVPSQPAVPVDQSGRPRGAMQFRDDGGALDDTDDYRDPFQQAPRVDLGKYGAGEDIQTPDGTTIGVTGTPKPRGIVPRAPHLTAGPTPPAPPANSNAPPPPAATGTSDDMPYKLSDLDYKPTKLPDTWSDDMSRAPWTALLAAGAETLGTGNIGRGIGAGLRSYEGIRDKSREAELKAAEYEDTQNFRQADVRKGVDSIWAEMDRNKKEDTYRTGMLQNDVTRTANEAAYQHGELGVRGAELSVERERLAREQADLGTLTPGTKDGQTGAYDRYGNFHSGMDITTKGAESMTMNEANEASIKDFNSRYTTSDINGNRVPKFPGRMNYSDEELFRSVQREHYLHNGPSFDDWARDQAKQAIARGQAKNDPNARKQALDLLNKYGVSSAGL